jgi:hypothetical protein
MARVVDEPTGTRGDFYITSVRYTRGIMGTRTELRMVPKGTVLTQ